MSRISIMVLQSCTRSSAYIQKIDGQRSECRPRSSYTWQRLLGLARQHGLGQTDHAAANICGITVLNIPKVARSARVCNINRWLMALSRSSGLTLSEADDPARAMVRRFISKRLKSRTGSVSELRPEFLANPALFQKIKRGSLTFFKSHICCKMCF